ncbi:hypothetical protein TMES_21545 [Thalassospira mesophila]|uniref:Uncharacterized protein n=1 Tax=Thalassospira mesophila TaxID=1293891 RepID=A0A1Y2KUS0_9PROT|nr:hypothetical protein TMES_21545 [Thalassospira mesophila]
MTIPQAIERAYAHWNAGQAQQAEDFARRVLAVSPAQIECLHLLGLIAHAYDKIDMALDYMRQACGFSYSPGGYFSNYAEMCRQNRLLGEAEKAGRIAVERAPDMVGAWNNLGIILQESGKLDEGITCLRRVVALEPENPEACNNLANTLLLTANFDEAQRFYERALELHPRYAEANSNLANLLMKQGKFDAAETYALRAIEINPQLVTAYLNLAEIAIECQQFDRAMQRLDALSRFAPEHPSALAARATVLHRQGEFDGALKAARAAVKFAPESASAHNILGKTQQALNLFEDAKKSFARAQALPGLERNSARVNLAEMHAAQNDKPAAIAILTEVVTDQPENIAAWGQLADIKKFSVDDPDLETLKNLYAQKSMELGLFDRVALCFSLGKAFLDVGDGENAFRYLGEGNTLKRETFAYDGAQTRVWLQSLASRFSQQWINDRAGLGNSSDMPVFVVGMPRSGTTLIEQILGAHPNIYPAGELRHISSLVENTVPAGLAGNSTETDDLARMAAQYLASVTPMAEGKCHIVDKMPANFLHLGWIHAMFPNARIIHCRRDPVDTCLSCYSKLFGAEQSFAYDLAELGQFYLGYRDLMAHWRDILPADRFIEVDYEAVVANCEAEARRLTDFIGVPWHDACLAFHQSRRPVRTASVNQVRQPLYKTSVGRWKPYAKQLKPLLDALGIDG